MTKARSNIIPLGVARLPVLDEQWRLMASCAYASPDIFFGEEDKAALKLARSYCFGCPSRIECLDYAIKTDTREGVWGGLTYKERLTFAKYA